MDYQYLILRRLLSKYEDNPHILQELAVARRVALHLGNNGRDLAAYAVANPSEREKIHVVARDLVERKLISLAWEPFTRGNVLATIWLNPDSEQIAKAYALIGIQPKGEITRQIREKLGSVLDNLAAQSASKHACGYAHTKWIHAALKEIDENIEKSGQLTPWLPDAPEPAIALLEALQALGQADFNGMNTSAFSTWLFRESNYFEQNVQRNLLLFVTRFYPSIKDFNFEISDDETLGLTGLYRSSETIEFCGPLALTFQGQKTDFAVYKFGGSLKAAMVNSIETVDAGRIKRLLFIEGRACYEQLLREGLADGDAIVLHGGIYSCRKSSFIKQVVAALPQDAEILYWGDIDLSGLTLYLLLSQRVSRPISTWRMDRGTLQSMRQRAVKFSDNYRASLIRARQDAAFELVADTLDCMLETGLRLSQDVFLPVKE